MDFINQLLNLVVSPVGLTGIIIGLLTLLKAKQSPQLAWFLFSLCGFAASLGKFRDEFTPEPPPLVFPLQQLRDAGRPLAIILLALLIILGIYSQRGWRQQLLPRAIQYLVIVQIVIFLKTLAFGSLPFAFLALLVFGAVIQMLRMGPSRWIQDDKSFNLAVKSIAIVGIIFVVLNAYQAIFDLNAITFVQGRFIGTTGNALHATVLLAAVVPCFMFFIESSQKWLWSRVFWVIGLTAVLYALFLTGSRTGVLMAGASILFFYRNQGERGLRLGLVLAVLAAFLPLVGLDFFSSVDSHVSNRYLAGENTRSAAWTGMWQAFSSYPLFGAPLVSDRLGFGENSWLATGATTGLLGFIPLVLFGIECLKMVLKLNRLSHRYPIYFLHTSTVIAGLASLLVGSFFEAFLLGNLTFSLIATLTYLLLGQYLLEVQDVQDYYLENQAELMNQAEAIYPDCM